MTTQTDANVTIKDLELTTRELEDISRLQALGLKLEVYRTATDRCRGIVRGLKIEVANLRPNSWNPNSMSVRSEEALGESLGEFGQVLEIVTRPDTLEDGFYQIIDGEHRFDRLSDQVSINILYGLTDNEAKKLTIILNETRGSADKIELAKLLAELGESMDSPGALQMGLPYNAVELEELIQLASVNWDDYEPGGEGEDGGQDGEGSGSDEWVLITVKLPKDAVDVVQQAYDLVGDAEKLPTDKAIAWGKVFKVISEEYLSYSDK